MQKITLFLFILLCASLATATDVLIYTRFGRSKGQFIHTCVAPCAQAIKELSEQNGLSAVISDDASQLTPDNLKQFKVIVLASTNNEIVDTDAQRDALFQFVENGGGLFAIHSALASERKSERFRELVGATFVSHPPYQPIDITIKDPAHPAVQGFTEADWKGYKDEVYVCKMATNVHVILETDMSRLTKAEAVLAKGFRIAPLAWTVPVGKGRVFVLALGHTDADYANHAQWRTLLNQALRWTLPQSAYTCAKTATGLRLTCGDQTIWSFEIKTPEGKPFIHPLTLPDGRVITDIRPADHIWHLGLWWCWKYINGVNYWEPRGNKGVVTDGETYVRDWQAAITGATATVTLDIVYRLRDQPAEPVMTEQRRVHFTAPDATGSYQIETHHAFTVGANQVLLERTPPKANSGGYAGFGVRLAPCCNDFTVTSSIQSSDQQTIRTAAVEWVDYSDPTNGCGITVQVLKGTPATRFYARKKFPFINPSPIYTAGLELAPHAKFDLAYRVTLHGAK